MVGYERDEEGRPTRAIYADRGPGRASAHRSGESLGGPIDVAFSSNDARGKGPRLSTGPRPERTAEQAEAQRQQWNAGAYVPPEVLVEVAPVERRRLSPDELRARLAPRIAPSLRPAVAVDRPVPALGGTLALDLALPCPDCSHLQVCRIRAAFAETVPQVLIPVLPDELHLAISPTVACDFFLARQDAREGVTSSPAPKDTAPTVASAARRAGAYRGGRPVLPRDRDEREEMVMAALRASSSTREAAARLGVGDTRVHGIVGEMRRGGRLPSEIASLLRARSRHRPTAP